MIAHFLRLLLLSNMVYTYAMTTYQSGFKWKEIPTWYWLRPILRGCQYSSCWKSLIIRSQKQCWYPLRIFNHLCCFCYLDGSRLVSACNNHRFVHLINIHRSFRRRTTGNFKYFGYSMFFISRVDPFRTVTYKKSTFILIQIFVQHWHTFIFGHTWIHSWLIHHIITFFFEPFQPIRLP